MKNDLIKVILEIESFQEFRPRKRNFYNAEFIVSSYFGEELVNRFSKVIDIDVSYELDRLKEEICDENPIYNSLFGDRLEFKDISGKDLEKILEIKPYLITGKEDDFITYDDRLGDIGLRLDIPVGDSYEEVFSENDCFNECGDMANVEENDINKYLEKIDSLFRVSIEEPLKKKDLKFGDKVEVKFFDEDDTLFSFVGTLCAKNINFRGDFGITIEEYKGNSAKINGNTTNIFIKDIIRIIN